MSSCHSVPASFNVFYAIQYLRSYSLESSESPGILILTTDHALTEWLWDETSAGEYPRPRLPKEISKPWTMPQVQTRILCRYIPDYAKTFCGFETFLFTLQLPPSTKVFAESDAESVDIIDRRFQAGQPTLPHKKWGGAVRTRDTWYLLLFSDSIVSRDMKYVWYICKDL